MHDKSTALAYIVDGRDTSCLIIFANRRLWLDKASTSARAFKIRADKHDQDLGDRTSPETRAKPKGNSKMKDKLFELSFS